MTRFEVITQLRAINVGGYIEMATDEARLKMASQIACYLTKGDKLFCRIDFENGNTIIKRVK